MKKLFNLIVILSIIIITTKPSFAYLDPGTGSMIIQIIIASVAAIGIFFKSIAASIKGLFNKNKAENEDDE